MALLALASPRNRLQSCESPFLVAELKKRFVGNQVWISGRVICNGSSAHPKSKDAQKQVAQRDAS